MYLFISNRCAFHIPNHFPLRKQLNLVRCTSVFFSIFNEFLENIYTNMIFQYVTCFLGSIGVVDKVLTFCLWVLIIIRSCPGFVSTYACKNSLEMSIVDASLYFLSITAVSKTLFVPSVRLLTSSIYVHYLCMIMLAQVLAFNIPSLFFVNNIKKFIAFCSYVLVILNVYMGSNLLSCASDSYLFKLLQNIYLQNFSFISWD